WGNNLMDFVRVCREGNDSIWMMIGQLVSRLDETLEVEMKLSEKYHFWMIGNKEVNRWRRVEHEY
ncbi:hypothetical protein A2U01_0118222, partial [Trifolium medium]|nr:hypothetical protein [Trifolium medium]